MAAKKESSSPNTSVNSNNAAAVNGNSSSKHASPSSASSANSEDSGLVAPVSTSTAHALEYFTPGSVVKCVTCHGKSVSGEVVAFDPNSRFLVLKSQASNRRSALNDVHFLNLNLVGDVSVLEEADTTVASTNASSEAPSLNVNRLTTRLQNNIERKKLNVRAFKAGVSPEGQKLFQAISKT